MRITQPSPKGKSSHSTEAKVDHFCLSLFCSALLNWKVFQRCCHLLRWLYENSSFLLVALLSLFVCVFFLLRCSVSLTVQCRLSLLRSRGPPFSFGLSACVHCICVYWVDSDACMCVSNGIANSKIVWKHSHTYIHSHYILQCSPCMMRARMW